METGTKLVRQATRGILPKMGTFAQLQVKKMLEENLIEKSKSK